MAGSEYSTSVSLFRPGSVIGHQQDWLIDLQHKMWNEGDIYRKKHREGNVLGSKARYPIYSLKLKSKLIAAESAKKSNNDLNYKRMVNKVENIKIGDDDNGNCTISPVSEDEENKNVITSEGQDDACDEETEVGKIPETKVLTQGDKLNQMKARKQQTQSLGPTNVENLIGYSRAKSVPSGVKLKPGAVSAATGKSSSRRAAATASAAAPQRLQTRASSRAAAAAAAAASAAASTSSASTSRKTSAVR